VYWTVQQMQRRYGQNPRKYQCNHGVAAKTPALHPLHFRCIPLHSVT